MAEMARHGEKREEGRKPCFFMAVDYATNNHVYTEPVQDISPSGLFIETETPLPVGTEINMVFTDFDTLRLIRVAGNVIRSSSQGIAVEFRFSDQEEQLRMDRFVSSL